MKRIIILTLAVLACFTFGNNAQAQEFPELDKSPMDMAYYPSRVAFRAFAKTEEEKNAKPLIRVTYSRPKADGRAVFTELEKPGNIWRVGANESTEVMFFEDVTIDGKKVKAGRYTIYIKLGEENWEVHFSTDTDGWGHYAFKPEESTVAKITVPTEETESTVEYMSIMFEEADPGAHMIIAWDDTMARVPIGLK
ncbi:DUF2911 domain-containing protein [Marivirga arenosa]|uniref:DUF2911 domain-containing protein n=1 Tax=Marivirga arenosa TaxID=3059076 RepID=A0AA51N720_9BACT|nr:DUF2911 domain-containing protein [Marivirga sp. ABR2-2]WMN07337.1 DUF2911 domain-containing protein [Marivirga sp. ABR2-2]